MTGPGPAGSPRARQLMVLSPLALLLLLWLAVLGLSGVITAGPNGTSMASDFAMLWTASRVQQAGNNPYDHHLLYATERSLLRREGLSAKQKRALVRVGYPPLFFWALRPLAALQFRLAAIIWMAGMFLALLAGWLVLLRRLNWSRKTVPALLFLAMPQSVLAVIYGNITSLFFAVLMSSLALAARFPFAAGALAALGWLKPQLALPFVLLIALFQAGSLKRYAAGFAAASVVLGLLNLGILGPESYRAWFVALFGYSSDIAAQPNLASFAGLYAPWVSSPLRLILEVIQAGGALALTWIAFKRSPPRRRESSSRAAAALWILWFLVVPYDHFPDEILLAFPVLLLIGRDAVNIASGYRWVALYLLLFSIVPFTWTPHRLEFLWLPLAALAVLTRSVPRGASPRQSLVAEPARLQPDEMCVGLPAKAHNANGK